MPDRRTLLRQTAELAEYDLLGRTVELHRRVTAGADAQLPAAGLGARQRQHGPAHACTDAREEVEPVAGVAQRASVAPASAETLRRRRRRRSTTIVIR